MYNLREVGPLALAVGLMLFGARAGVADDKPETKPETAEQKALDAEIRKSLFDVIDFGATLHNGGDVPAGYRVYQSALMTVRPLLGHRPDVQAYIKSGMLAAERLPVIEDRSFKLREVLDKVREVLKSGEVLAVENKTLWDRLGGEKGVGALVDDFMVRASKDPRVNFGRGNKVKIDADTFAKVRKVLMKQASYLTGGPDKPDKDVTPPWKDLGISDLEFRAGRENLMAAMKDARVAAPDGQELIEAIDALYKDIVSPKAAPKTVWEALGGETGVNQIVDDFIKLAKEDKAVNFDRGGKYKLDADNLAKVKKELVRQISYMTSGPDKPEKDAPPPWKGLGITESEFDAAAKDFVDALKKNNVSSQMSAALQLSIVDMRSKIVEGKPEPAKVKVWDRIGGDKTVAKIVDDYYTAAAKSAKANLNQGGTVKLEGAAVEKIKKQLTAQIAAASGGPISDQVKPFDKGAKLTDEEFTARKDALKEALGKQDLKSDDVKAILEAFEAWRKDVVESKKTEEKPKESEVSGTVTVDGKPLASGKIGFIGADKKEINGEVKDGKYKLMGLKPGSYRVTIKAGEEIGPQYGLAATTPLQVEIAKDKEPLDITLRGKK